MGLEFAELGMILDKLLDNLKGFLVLADNIGAKALSLTMIAVIVFIKLLLAFATNGLHDQRTFFKGRKKIIHFCPLRFI
jgi:hypothetical protein